MKGKIWVMLVCFMLMFVFGIVDCYANEQLTVGILPVQDNSGYKNKPGIFDPFNRAIKAKFSTDKYLICEQSLDNLIGAGITDLNSIERADLIEYGKRKNMDYVVFSTVMPLTLVYVGQKNDALFESYTATVALNIKIVDVKKEKYVYAKTISATYKNKSLLGVGTVAAVKGAVDGIIEQLNNEAAL